MLLYVIVLAFAFTVLCRATHMDHETELRVRTQYRVALVLAALSLPVFGLGEYSAELMGLALCSFLWIERRAPRCNDSPSLHGIEPERLRHVSGGRRD